MYLQTVKTKPPHNKQKELQHTYFNVTVQMMM